MAFLLHFFYYFVLHLFLGYSKEAMKKVQQFQATERFEANVETEAIVNAKYQYVYEPHNPKMYL